MEYKRLPGKITREEFNLFITSDSASLENGYKLIKVECQGRKHGVPLI